MKVVFDTNVIISAYLTAAGNSQYVFFRALKRHLVVLSPFILQESKDKMMNKLGLSEIQVEEMINFLKRRAYIVEPVQTAVDFKDKKDIPILSLAALPGVQYLITGDKALLDLRRQGMCAIVSLREAMEFL